jgi:arginyl-tRNA synthetase
MNSDIKEKLQELIEGVIKSLYPEASIEFIIEHPEDMKNGDYSTNVAMSAAPKLKKNPIEIAVQISEKIEAAIETDPELKKYIQKIEVAGAGFINFYLTPEFFADSIKEIVGNEKFGRNTNLSGKKIAVEYTDPNPFKQFHIGHLMTNIIGESLARLYEFNGAEVKRFCYQGDVGRHVALCIWGFRLMDEPVPEDDAPLAVKTKFLGDAYAKASQKVKDEPELEEEIRALNKKIYERADPEVNAVYDKGKEWSLEHFEEIYKILGTSFDQYFFESQIADRALQIVRENTPKVFKESEGALIFQGEEHGLHTRVFVTKEGLPIYEAKELALAKVKYESYPYDQSISVTGNEINEYFRVVLKALSLIEPELAAKTLHVSHGMLRLPEGKMSSRTGNVITGESLLNEMIAATLEKMKDREFEKDEKKKISQDVAVGAIKYSILKQSIGKDIVFDREKSLSFEGDSGPYLQYAHTRAVSVLKKAKEEKIEKNPGTMGQTAESQNELSKKLYRFPEVVEESLRLYAPQLMVTYLTDIASTFNHFYAKEIIVDKNNQQSGARVALVDAFRIVIKNGLEALGIPIPSKM